MGWFVIDRLLGEIEDMASTCGHCGKLLQPWHVSRYFCDAEHQQAWYESQHTTDELNVHKPLLQPEPVTAVRIEGERGDVNPITATVTEFVPTDPETVASIAAMVERVHAAATERSPQRRVIANPNTILTLTHEAGQRVWNHQVDVNRGLLGAPVFTEEYVPDGQVWISEYGGGHETRWTPVGVVGGGGFEFQVENAWQGGDLADAVFDEAVVQPQTLTLEFEAPFGVMSDEFLRDVWGFTQDQIDAARRRPTRWVRVKTWFRSLVTF